MKLAHTASELASTSTTSSELRFGTLQTLIDPAQVRQSAAGGMHTVALLDNGSVQSWGVNDEGALGRQTAGELWDKAEVRPQSCRAFRV